MSASATAAPPKSKTIEIHPVADLPAELKKLEAKLPMQFGVTCTKCNSAKKVRRDIFIKRVEKFKGDIKTLMQHYHCSKCRKNNNVDAIGNAKVAGGSTKIITIDDLSK